MERQFYALAEAIVLGSTLAACAIPEEFGEEDPRREDGELEINFVTTSPTVAGMFVDAATGDIIADAVVTGRVLSDELDDPEGAAFSAEGGMISFDLGERLPTEEEPVVLKLTAEAEGYLPTSATLTLTDGENGDVILKLVNLTAPPEGVAVAVDTSAVTDEGGALAEEVVIAVGEAEKGDTASPRAELTLPAGSVFSDENGETLTGALTTTVAVFGTDSEEALQAFPGGFALTEEVEGPSLDDEEWEEEGEADEFADDEDDSDVDVDDSDDAAAEIEDDEAEEDGGEISFRTRPRERHSNNRRRATFLTAGFTAVSVTNARGRRATSVSQPVRVAQAVSPRTDNPQTGQKLKAGDEIPLWGYEQKTGRWSYAGTVVAQASMRWDLNITYETNWPAYYNLDWQIISSCSKSGILRIEGNEQNVPLSFVIFRRDDAGRRVERLWGSNSSGTVARSEYRFYRPPANMPVVVDISSQGRKVASVESDDLCTMDKTVRVELPATVELPVIALARCNGVPVEYALPLRYRLYPGGGWNTGWLKNLLTKLPGIVPNSTYEVAVNAFDSWFTTTMNSGNGEELKFDLALDALTCELFERSRER